MTVNAVSLSTTRNTPATEQQIPESDTVNVFKKAFERQTFDVIPEDIAETVVYLAGNNHVKPIISQIISANGGASFPE